MFFLFCTLFLIIHDSNIIIIIIIRCNYNSTWCTKYRNKQSNAIQYPASINIEQTIQCNPNNPIQIIQSKQSNPMQSNIHNIEQTIQIIQCNPMQSNTMQAIQSNPISIKSGMFVPTNLCTNKII